jgi:hypothetical protein
MGLRPPGPFLVSQSRGNVMLRAVKRTLRWRPMKRLSLSLQCSGLAVAGSKSCLHRENCGPLNKGRKSDALIVASIRTVSPVDGVNKWFCYFQIMVRTIDYIGASGLILMMYLPPYLNTRRNTEKHCNGDRATCAHQGHVGRKKTDAICVSERHDPGMIHLDYPLQVAPRRSTTVHKLKHKSTAR